MKKQSLNDRVLEIKGSSSYRVAFEDMSFLSSEDLRPVRLQLELLKPEMILEKEGIKATIVVFGSARICDKESAMRRVLELKDLLKKNPANKVAGEDLIRAQAILRNSRYYDEARRFASLVSKRLAPQGVTIVTGGGPGIMEAANRGASELGAKSVGLNITLPFEQNPNPYITPRLCFQFHYFAIRKMHFLLRAKALVAFPGGYGTMDEFFEGLTLVQTGKIQKFPIILFGKEYWSKAINFQFLLNEGVIAPKDLKLFHFVENAEEALKIIKKNL